MSNTETTSATPYDRAAIFEPNGPISPIFMRESVRTLIRTLPLDTAEPLPWQHRRMYSALLALSALHPRDEIEVMLGVQAMSAYHAAASCWHLGMNHHRPNGDSTRHITSAASAARAFDTMLRAIERRQAKALAVPPGRPASRPWDEPHPTTVMNAWAETCANEAPAVPAEPDPVWTPEMLQEAGEFLENDRIEKENEGLDIANTEGILPGGGMIMPEDPTPQQEAYYARRLGLSLKREYAENLRKGINKMPKIPMIRAGDLIP